MKLDMSSTSSRRMKKVLNFTSLAVATAGLLLGLLTLVSAAGVWIGVWDFRRGFDLLRMANAYGDIIAWTCLGLTLAILFAAKLWNTGNIMRLGVLAATGTVIAGIAYAIPETFRPPEGVNYPPIHDISTDLVNPPEFVAVLALRADAPNTVIYGGSPDMTPARLAELTREAYPDLVPRTYSEPLPAVFQRALAAVTELGWDLVAADQQAGRIEATATTFWFRFKDDIVITFTESNGQTLVNARSLSRVGVGDVGANALRLRRFFEIL